MNWNCVSLQRELRQILGKCRDQVPRISTIEAGVPVILERDVERK
jgi:hypothetical protein